ncbi:MAG: signal peptidase I [Allosphingosinicella sp.]
MASAKAAKKKGGPAESIRFLLLLFLFAVLLRTFVVAPFMIPSGSMMPDLRIGDYLFVAKWPYGYSRYSMPFGLGSFQGRYWASEPVRGDVVVFRYPGENEDWVKRLIGLPGDRVQMRGGQLFLNAKAVPKVRIADWLMPVTANSPCRYGGQTRAPSIEGGSSICRYPRFRETLPGDRSYEVLDQVEGWADDTPVYTVPAGHYFMMGDNRDDSADSRFSLEQKGVGLLPSDYVIGRALIAFFSTDGSAEWVKPWTWFSAARWDRVGRTF